MDSAKRQFAEQMKRQEKTEKSGKYDPFNNAGNNSSTQTIKNTDYDPNKFEVPKTLKGSSITPGTEKFRSASSRI